MQNQGLTFASRQTPFRTVLSLNGLAKDDERPKEKMPSDWTYKLSSSCDWFLHVSRPYPYYSVLFHELAHSSGHASRLDRATLNQRMAFGDTNYSKEELCAEMGAAYLCGVAGIVNETVNNSAAYIQGWLGKLRNDKKLLIQAAASAQKASDFILGESKA